MAYLTPLTWRTAVIKCCLMFLISFDGCFNFTSPPLRAAHIYATVEGNGRRSLFISLTTFWPSYLLFCLAWCSLSVTLFPASVDLHRIFLPSKRCCSLSAFVILASFESYKAPKTPETESFYYHIPSPGLVSNGFMKCCAEPGRQPVFTQDILLWQI